MTVRTGGGTATLVPNAGAATVGRARICVTVAGRTVCTMSMVLGVLIGVRVTTIEPVGLSDGLGVGDRLAGATATVRRRSSIRQVTPSRTTRQSSRKRARTS